MPSRTTKGPDVACSTCGGTGKVKLSLVLWRVLTMVQDGQDTATLIYAALEGESDVKKCAINNRLEELRAFGLLGRTMRGRQWVYHRTEPKTEQSTDA
jgi:hypothetical protein